MKNRRGLNNMFNIDRKVLYVVLGIVMISVITLTIVYAALSTTLNINGNAEVTAASWDIYLDNVQLNSNSVTKNVPTIIDKTTATFSTTLTKPGDFYEFTIDVVNDGSIDAMIDSVTKTPELSDTQKKYLNYIVEYQNGESITTKQLVAKKTFVRLIVKIGFRSDILASDIPQTSEILNLSFKVNYVQSDENATIVNGNGIKKSLDVVSGNLETVGSEIAIGDEHFYIISSNEDSVTMLAKYNLYVGNGCPTASSCAPYGDEATGLQDKTMLGWTAAGAALYGTVEFSNQNYWSSIVSSYPTYVYDSNSSIYNYVENYKSYLEGQGIEVEEARLIKYEELIELGCSRSSYSCSGAPSWVYSSSYWTGTADGDTFLWRVVINNDFDSNTYSYNNIYGVRPVIVIKI